MTAEEFKKLLGVLTKEREEIEKLETTIPIFNIFEALDIHDKEVKICTFITALLQIKDTAFAPGVSFLQSFFNEVLGRPDLYAEAADWIVENEKAFRNEHSETNGVNQRRIDILISSPTANINIPVEVKIHSGDREGQIKDNVLFLKDKNLLNQNAYYLNLDGHDPDESSYDGVNKDRVITISFKKEIKEWLEKRKIKDFPELESSIKMFITNIDSLTHYKDLNKYHKLLDLLVKDEDITSIYTTNEILEEQTAHLLKTLFSSVAKKLRKTKNDHNLNDDNANREWRRYDDEQLKGLYNRGTWPGYSVVLTREFINKENNPIHLVARLVLNRDKDYIFVELTTETTKWRWDETAKNLKDIFDNDRTYLIDEEEYDSEDSFQGHVIVKSKAIKDKEGNIPSFYRLNKVSLAMKNDIKEYAEICAKRLIDLVERTLKLLAKQNLTAKTKK